MDIGWFKNPQGVVPLPNQPNLFLILRVIYVFVIQKSNHAYIHIFHHFYWWPNIYLIAWSVDGNFWILLGEPSHQWGICYNSPKPWLGSRLMIHFYSQILYNLRWSVLGFTSVFLYQILNHYSNLFGNMTVSIFIIILLLLLLLFIYIWLELAK